jgi:hypothetical protein
VPTRTASLLSLLAILLGAGCGAPARPHTETISLDGRIGPLRVGASDAGAVVRHLGRPAADVRTRERYSGIPYRMLGYECSDAADDDAWPVTHHGFCRTVFFVNLRSDKLGAVFTSSDRFVEAHGVRIGMPTRRADRLLHRRAQVGCSEDIRLGSRNAALTIAFTGGRAKIEHGAATDLIGGRVELFVLHSRSDDVGVWDCL